MLEIFNLNGKLALVTGGGSGLGRIMSLALSDAGAEVIVTGRRTDKLESVVKEIKEKAETVKIERYEDKSEGSREAPSALGACS